MTKSLNFPQNQRFILNILFVLCPVLRFKDVRTLPSDNSDNRGMVHICTRERQETQLCFELVTPENDFTSSCVSSSTFKKKLLNKAQRTKCAQQSWQKRGGHFTAKKLWSKSTTHNTQHRFLFFGQEFGLKIAASNRTLESAACTRLCGG